MFDLIRSAMANYTVILEPDENTPEWWAGAPSVCPAPDGTFYLACRMREGHSPRGRRGYEVRILHSEDGLGDFVPIFHLRREEAGVPGFERPALVRDPRTGAYRLYGCAGLEDGWAILKWDDVDDPAHLQPRSAHVVLQAEQAEEPHFAHVAGYKDPFVFWDGSLWHMFVIGYDRVERIWHFTSDDGERWERLKGPAMENSGWHNFYTRPACVLPLALGYLFVYEGSHVLWRDPVYNIATGLAYTPDLESFLDLTPAEPLLTSSTPGDYSTWRYSHWLRVGDQIRVYAEVARPNNTNEIRLGLVQATDALAATRVGANPGR